MSEPVHGKATALVDLQPHRLWHQLQEPIQVGRYHSWAVKAAGLKTNLRVLASDQNGNPMAAEYPGFRAVGLQFHPESILTPQGDRILKNWWEGLPQNH
jgi:anthranilate synthase component 2